MMSSLEEMRAQRAEESYYSRTTEIQRQLEASVNLNYDRAIQRLNKVSVLRLTHPGQLLPLEEIKKIITSLLEPTVMTLCTGDIPVMDFSSDIKSEYYDSLVTPQVTSITYSLLCITSDYLVGMLLYYVQKQFVFNYILNDIVRPNIVSVINNVRSVLNRRDVMDEELRKTEEFNELLQDLVESLVVEVNIDKFQDKLTSILKYDVKDKNDKISTSFDNSRYFVPDVLYNICINGNATDTDIERATRFLERYTLAHSTNAISELFRHYSKQTNLNESVIKDTIMERNAYHSINNLQLLDGLTFVENKIANRIISFTVANEDHEFINRSPVLKNIKSIVDKFHRYNSTIKLTGNDVVISHEDGSIQTYNFRKEGLSKLLNDPFTMFKQSEFIKHTFFNMKPKSAFYQTGITKSEDSDLLINNVRNRLLDKTPEERVQHRNAQIKKLLNECRNNSDTMKEYKRLTTEKIKAVKYMNPTQTKTYVLEDKHRLLLTLTETEFLYRQLLNEVAAQAKSDNYTGGR